jgi:hypothetical protein
MKVSGLMGRLMMGCGESLGSRTAQRIALRDRSASLTPACSQHTNRQRLTRFPVKIVSDSRVR